MVRKAVMTKGGDLFFSNFFLVFLTHVSLRFAVTQTLIVFVKIFKKSRDENAQQAEAERKKLEKEALKEKNSSNSAIKKEANVMEKLKFGSKNLKQQPDQPSK